MFTPLCDDSNISHHTHTHTHTHTQALDWCIESAELLSEHDIITITPADIDPENTKQEFDQFLTDFPPPSKKTLQQMLDLMESTENHWIKDNALFAYNRVLEITERFHYYQRALEAMIAERREEERQQEASEKELVQETKNVVSAVNSLVSKASGSGEPGTDDVFDESTGVLLDQEDQPDAPFGRRSTKSLTRERNSKDSNLSIHDADIDEALMLLEQAVTNASFRLDSQRAEPPPGTLGAGEWDREERAPSPRVGGGILHPHFGWGRLHYPWLQT